VLENHHVAAAFKILKDEKYNIFKNFEKDDYKHVREHLIQLVFATDMKFHFSNLSKLKGRLGTEGCLQFFLHHFYLGIFFFF